MINPPPTPEEADAWRRFCSTDPAGRLASFVTELRRQRDLPKSVTAAIDRYRDAVMDNVGGQVEARGDLMRAIEHAKHRRCTGRVEQTVISLLRELRDAEGQMATNGTGGIRARAAAASLRAFGIDPDEPYRRGPEDGSPAYGKVEPPAAPVPSTPTGKRPVPSPTLAYIRRGKRVADLIRDEDDYLVVELSNRRRVRWYRDRKMFGLEGCSLNPENENYVPGGKVIETYPPIAAVVERRRPRG